MLQTTRNRGRMMNSRKGNLLNMVGKLALLAAFLWIMLGPVASKATGQFSGVSSFEYCGTVSNGYGTCTEQNDPMCQGDAVLCIGLGNCGKNKICKISTDKGQRLNTPHVEFVSKTNSPIYLDPDGSTVINLRDVRAGYFKGYLEGNPGNFKNCQIVAYVSENQRGLNPKPKEAGPLGSQLGEGLDEDSGGVGQYCEPSAAALTNLIKSSRAREGRDYFAANSADQSEANKARSNGLVTVEDGVLVKTKIIFYAATTDPDRAGDKTVVYDVHFTSVDTEV